MSNNKYIIDKDSLTEIADNIRNKLGTGEATTDETTGKIIYPEDKGYYWKKQLVCSFDTIQFNGKSYASSAFEYCFSYKPSANNNISWDDMIINLCGETPTKIKIMNKTLYDGQVYFHSATGTKTTLFNSSSIRYSEIILPYQSFGDNENVYIAAATPGDSSGTNWTLPKLEISFLDENNNFYIIKNDYTDLKMLFRSTAYSMPFLERSFKTLIPLSVDDIKNRINNYLSGRIIDYEGLSYSFITLGMNPNSWSGFSQTSKQTNWLTFIPLTSGQKVGFCVGETAATRLRATFFKEKTYSDWQQYVKNSSSSSINRSISTNGTSITGTTELSGDGLLKRFYYTAPSNGTLIVQTSNDGTAAPIHVWEVK